ncbi:hypothetical protein [Piscirickettsia litoralis]|uniref:Uncharacterized protein n=1 Tax=Piscirickettsia litoralis TaxID=1891921 RepID=A0ABX2ZYC5_9GAMM|nr:hypothetical protein [Piscirickettsia litoralis]ODN41503.1 hypothetical protein BGC07_15455 [Piscirickettsia litoralis]
MNEYRQELMKKAEAEFNEIFDDVQKSVICVTENIDKQSEQLFYFTGFMNMLVDQLINYELEIAQRSSNDGALCRMILNKFNTELQEKIKKNRQGLS